ncbi:GNAT family N-acetyltransferase [Clostridium sardiniense]|uniref:GNAT family N-acetyltransferase n=1 Tax=Clostridium sardiniense TaxID=29369 RepID=A0ABS7L1L7_CLOSR|nr:GNAT family N-acetyltransferase [Clostridium sardiniense]MBY0756949.1 GNAT family N-acetyltransferase [Clostridium sardiniense]MBY0756973.1 GNAT family N-acetyltransferase [Clostridium sardiniense]MDQ0460370.1 GNAT superfamily N-acetyltransferase [Clostridium sardiniense]
MENIKVIHKFPRPTQYNELRKSVGWNPLQTSKVKLGLENSTYCICIEKEDILIGFGRIVGDGATIFYIQDLMINPLYQKQNIGTLIMNKLMDYINNHCDDNSFIGLIALNESDKFYKQFGFTYHKNNNFYRYKL